MIADQTLLPLALDVTPAEWAVAQIMAGRVPSGCRIGTDLHLEFTPDDGLGYEVDIPLADLDTLLYVVRHLAGDRRTPPDSLSRLAS
jgi:hypothetical protein